MIFETDHDLIHSYEDRIFYRFRELEGTFSIDCKTYVILFLLRYLFLNYFRVLTFNDLIL